VRLPLLLPLLGLLAGCAPAGSADGRVVVLASSYPFAWAAEQVAGGDAVVRDLVKSGVEPHDIELSPRQIGSFETATVVVYLKTFQPAVDDAVLEAPKAARLDLTSAVDVRRRDGGVDPHVWLDPVRMADIVRAVADRLVSRDAAHAAAYRSREAASLSRLQALDALFATALRSCPRKQIVTAHEAFGYLADRYGLDQVGVSGISPEAEPSPGRIARVAAYARRHDVRTIFFESTIDPKLADTVAREIGARTAVLDPIEGVAHGDDYLSVMRRDAAALHEGLGCT